MLAQYFWISLIWPHFCTCTVLVSQRKQFLSLPIVLFIYLSTVPLPATSSLSNSKQVLSPHSFLSFIPLIMLSPYLLSITFFPHSFLCPPHYHSSTLSFILLTLNNLGHITTNAARQWLVTATMSSTRKCMAFMHDVGSKTYLCFELVLVKEGTYHTGGKEGRSECFKILQYYTHYQSNLKILTPQMMFSAIK